MRIRTATGADAPRIAEIHAASWQSTYRGLLSDDYLDHTVAAERSRIWAERFRAPAPGQYVLVAEAGPELIGFACAYGGCDPHWGTLLDNLHVAPARQSRGAGRLLIGQVAVWAADRHAGEGLFLWVLRANQRAQRFYQGLGAACAGESEWHAPSGERIPEFRYAWPSPQALLERLPAAD